MNELWYKVRRVISVMLVVALSVTTAPVGAFADDDMAAAAQIPTAVSDSAEPAGEPEALNNEEVPPASSEAAPPASSEATPPADGEATPPADGEATPPASSEAAPPASSEAAPPASGEATPPASGEARRPILRRRGPVEPVPGEPEEQIWTVTVYYLFEDGTTARPVDSRQYVAGEAYSFDVPAIPGYTTLLDSEAFSEAQITGTASADVSYVVTYVAGMVNYTVLHKYENLDGSFEEVREEKQGLVGADTESAPVNREGFTAQPYAETTIAADGTTVVTISYLRNTQYLNYQTSGGSYVARQEGKYGATVDVTDEQPVRNGFSFEGWYLDEGLNTPAGATVTLNGDVTLYAKWAGEEVGYTVIYWLENADDDGYSYYKTVTGRRATAGEQVQLTQRDVESIRYFTFERSDAVTVKADGSSIVNVYYSRNEYTLTFQVKKNWWSSTWTTVATIKAKYDANIADKWPIVGNDGTLYNSGWVWDDTGSTYEYILATIEKMPGTNVTFHGEKRDADNTIYYYVETLPGQRGDTTFNGKSFTLYKTVPTGINYLTYDEEFHPIQGFDRYGSNPAFRNGSCDFSRGKASLYYSRNSYDLTFYNYNGVDKTTQLLYQASLSDQNYTPNRPSSLPEYYTFQGWYTTEDCLPGTQVDFGSATMPAGDLIVYAKWAAPVYTVSFDSNGGTPVEPQEVEGGKTASRPADPIREGYTFAGWYEDAGFAGSSYDFEGKPVSADITLHAKWVPVTVTSYTVRYLIKDTGEALFDEVVRPGNVGAAVFANAKSHSDYVADALSKSIKLEAAASQNVITFWYSKPSDLGYTVKFVDEEGALLAEYTGAPVSSTQIVVRASDYTIPAGYQVTNPIYTLRLQGDESLNVATFVCKLQEYQITYHLDGGSAENPTSYTVKSDNITLNNPTRDHYEFIGWSGTGLTGSDNMTVTIPTGSTGDRSYTAHWKRSTFNITYAADANGSVSPTSETVNAGEDAVGSKATPATGYQFTNWTNEAGDVVSESATFAPQDVLADATYTAHFAPKDYQVVYSWTGAPESETLPENQTVKFNAPYTIDSTYTSETVVETTDAYGNVTGRYTFSGWTDPNNGVMTTEGVTVNGTWTFEEVTVAKYDVNYSWDGDVPETETLPESITGLVKGQPYTVDSTYTSETIVYTYDAYNNINGQYTFSGWTDPNSGVMGESNVTVSGTWTFEEVAVAKYDVNYSWDGDVPETETLPESIIGLAKNQPYTIDTTYTSETVVETTDAYGNVNGRYTFSGWTDPNNGVMGESNVTVSGTWTFTEVEVAEYTITYMLDGAFYASETKVYNQPISLMADPADREGYTFSGWTVENYPDGLPATMPAESLVVVGSFTVNNYDYTVNHIYLNREGVEVDRDPESGNAAYGTTITYSQRLVYQDQTYLFNSDDGPKTIGIDPAQNVLNVYYDIDVLVDPDKDPDEDPDNGDQIPDKFQVVVNYEAANGTPAISSEVLTLTDENGVYSETGTAQASMPEVTAAEGYTWYDKNWYTDDTYSTVANATVTADTTFYAYCDEDDNGDNIPDKFQVTVTYVAENGTPAIASELLNLVDENGNYSETGTAQASMPEVTAAEGYTWYDKNWYTDDTYTTVANATVTADTTFYAYCDTDVLVDPGKDPDGDPDNGDGIPDKYQVVVTFEAINGVVRPKGGTDADNAKSISTVVTLLDENGMPAANGTGYLTDAQIPEALSNMGYDGDSAVWTPETPTTTYGITKTMTFVVDFSANGTPVTPPDEGGETPTTPTTPVTPGTEEPEEPAEETPAEEELEDEEAPLASGEEGEELEDEEAPLAAPAGAAWALLNLILAILTALGSVLLLIGYIGKKKKEEEDETGENVEYTVKKKGVWRVLSLIPGIGAIVAFILTENMRNPMVFTDRWTLLMVIIAVIQVIVAILAKKEKEEPDDREAQA